MSNESKSRRISLKELARRTLSESLEDDVLGQAAELSYYFLLALFPLLIFLTTLIGFLPDAQSGLENAIARFAPPDALKLVRETLNDIVSHRSGGLISFALLGSIWAASSGVDSLMHGLNVAYDAKETRPYWKRRLIAIALTIEMSL